MVPGQVTPLTGYSISGANIGYEGNRVSYGDNRFEILIGGGGAGYMPGFSSAGVGGARLDENGRGVIPVTVDFGQEFNSYKTSLRVTLFYGYTEYIERPIRIYKVPDPQVDMLYPDFGFSGNQMLYPTGTHGYKYFGYHEDPFGHDVWRYVDGNKNLDIQIITT